MQTIASILAKITFSKRRLSKDKNTCQKLNLCRLFTSIPYSTALKIEALTRALSPKIPAKYR